MVPVFRMGQEVSVGQLAGEALRDRPRFLALVPELRDVLVSQVLLEPQLGELRLHPGGPLPPRRGLQSPARVTLLNADRLPHEAGHAPQ